eukprot:scaffold30961_cov101-Skeletonema_dohrnii-CCMP3373.AAC.1
MMCCGSLLSRSLLAPPSQDLSLTFVQQVRFTLHRHNPRVARRGTRQVWHCRCVVGKKFFFSPNCNNNGRGEVFVCMGGDQDMCPVRNV